MQSIDAEYDEGSGHYEGPEEQQRVLMDDDPSNDDIAHTESDESLEDYLDRLRSRE